MPRGPMEETKYDIIGDIHGYAGQLTRLLTELGYREKDGCFQSERKVIFLGDFIDKGPAIRQTLEIVRPMVDAGSALAVMGNHEYNAIAYHTPDGRGGYFREHTLKNVKQHEATLESFANAEEQWAEYLRWFTTLPLFLDLHNLRVVHACWNEQAIRDLGGSNRFDRTLLSLSGIKRDVRQEAVNTLLKGPEIDVPGGLEYDGRKEMRVKWWSNDRPFTYRNVALQVPFELPNDPITQGETKKVCGYPPNATPVFFGH
jgi:Calcineurin-like phosphoesterase